MYFLTTQSSKGEHAFNQRFNSADALVGVLLIKKQTEKKEFPITECTVYRCLHRQNYKGPFPLRAWKRAFFVSFIDLRLKRAQNEINKTNKECSFPRS